MKGAVPPRFFVGKHSVIREPDTARRRKRYRHPPGRPITLLPMGGGVAENVADLI